MTSSIPARVARFPGAPWSAVGLAAVVGAAAVVVAGVGVRGAALHALGWPLLLGLLASYSVAASSSPSRRGAPARLAFLAYCFGTLPLLESLIFGPPVPPEAGPWIGLVAMAANGAVFALVVTLGFELLYRYGER